MVHNNDIDGLQLPKNVADQICQIINVHWKELITDPGKIAYLSTFFLDPC